MREKNRARAKEVAAVNRVAAAKAATAGLVREKKIAGEDIAGAAKPVFARLAWCWGCFWPFGRWQRALK